VTPGRRLRRSTLGLEPEEMADLVREHAAVLGVLGSEAQVDQTAVDRALQALRTADLTGVSRATAQRYLADLARDGRVQLTLRYGSTGRPEHCFEWLGRRR
jgi:hypothetical protein